MYTHTSAMLIQFSHTPLGDSGCFLPIKKNHIWRGNSPEIRNNKYPVAARASKQVGQQLIVFIYLTYSI